MELQSGRSSASGVKVTPIVGIVLVALVALFAILAYAPVGKASYLQTCGVLILLGVSAASVGGFTGFLFGIPRSLVTQPGNGTAGALVGNISRDPTQPNTNLEQISDWLAKVLVGATLTQLGTIPQALGRLFDRLALVIGDARTGPVFVGSLLIYAVVVGFVFGWISARIWLPIVMDVLAVKQS